jgi:hypothetical protein
MYLSMGNGWWLKFVILDSPESFSKLTRLKTKNKVRMTRNKKRKSNTPKITQNPTFKKYENKKKSFKMDRKQR